jgi:hypothetical protein
MAPRADDTADHRTNSELLNECSGQSPRPVRADLLSLRRSELSYAGRTGPVLNALVSYSQPSSAIGSRYTRIIGTDQPGQAAAVLCRKALLIASLRGAGGANPPAFSTDRSLFGAQLDQILDHVFQPIPVLTT